MTRWVPWMLGAVVLTACNGKNNCSKDAEIAAFVDGDGDGYGGEAASVCVVGEGYASTGGDCNDSDASVYPAADEPACDGVDSDCDGADNGPEQVLFYQDVDGDEYGNADFPLLACEAPDDTWARFDQDCDDNDAARNPGANEVCNDGVDDDCDTLADDEDDSLDTTTVPSWFPDGDGDGYGKSGTSVQSCAPAPDAVDNEDDCDDSDAYVHPGATEICNRVDDDCDTLRDDDDDSLDPAGQMSLFADTDGDGFGDALAPIMACGPRPGLASSNDTDCDDTNPDVSPADNEVLCDLADNDCDAATPDDADRDEDGFFTCADTDCNDLQVLINPAADEIPDDGVDENCDGYEACYQDVDGDGSRTSVPALVADPQCNMNTSVHANRPIDCDDNDAGITISGLWWRDRDNDGFGDGEVALEQCDDPGAGFVLDGGEVDCDDLDDTTYPGADDPCNDDVDSDCDTIDSCTTCGEWLATDGSLPSGVYAVRPNGIAEFDVYCDMETDGGGWTLVGSTFQGTLNDAAGGYYADLSTVSPGSAHSTVWSGLRGVLTDGDVRFACKTRVEDEDFAVDLSFYDVPWYDEITTGTDLQSCFTEGGNPDPTPVRRNNVTGVLANASNAYNSGGLEGEDNCGDTDDFTVDFDDAGMDSDEADGTDWGEDDGKQKCGSAGSGQAWFLFVREP